MLFTSPASFKIAPIVYKSERKKKNVLINFKQLLEWKFG